MRANLYPFAPEAPQRCASFKRTPTEPPFSLGLQAATLGAERLAAGPRAPVRAFDIVPGGAPGVVVVDMGTHEDRVPSGSNCHGVSLLGTSNI